MAHKASAIAPANIAFIKYWGQKDPKTFLPFNGSLSMNLSDCTTHTTVEFREDLTTDEIQIAFEGGAGASHAGPVENEFAPIRREDGDKHELAFAQVDRVKALAEITAGARVQSRNNFPADSGIASSASGFAALTLALVTAAGLNDLVKNHVALSTLVRAGGSVSAMRSVMDGFVEIAMTADGADCEARQVAPPDHWLLFDLVAVVNTTKKSVSSSAGHLRAETSPHFAKRLEDLKIRLPQCRQAIQARDFGILGHVMEEDALSMHQVMQTSDPPINYFMPETVALMEAVRQWRAEGLPVYFTIDAGPNVHVIVEESYVNTVREKLAYFPGVQRVIINHPAQSAHVVDDHLF